MTTTIGWDIGGAHLKAALLRDGRIEAVEQRACTLWLGTEHLAEGWQAIVEQFGPADCHAVTMTGELAEIFSSRGEGVAAICGMAAELAAQAVARFYAGPYGFLDQRQAAEAWQHVASANWHASAAWTARKIGDGLFIDIGSTTTDIIPLAAGRPAVMGYTDAQRLETGELVYTGVMRTSLMALAAEAPFAGRRQRLMAENFATTADLYRLGGELSPDDDSYPASDGRSKSLQDCRARIARMFGRDADEAGPAMWDEAARFFRERQLRSIGEAIAQVLSAGAAAPDAPFIAAGAGHFLVPELARRFGRRSERFAALVPAPEEARRKAGVCAPAVAVALLAADRREAIATSSAVIPAKAGTQ
jgi:(4-(4-[2-(gamma-L-glutamylamino)ethyl]phenoxymethyl)furan-2-yl)methanamine synthase